MTCCVRCLALRSTTRTMEGLTDTTIALLDAIGAVIIGAIVTFFATHYYLRSDGDDQKKATERAQPTPASSGGTKTGSKSSNSAGTAGFGSFDNETTLQLIKTRRSIFPKVSKLCLFCTLWTVLYFLGASARKPHCQMRRVTLLILCVLTAGFRRHN